MKSLMVAAALAIAALTGTANAAPMLDSDFGLKSDKPLQISDTTLGAGEEFACYGCLSTETGRPRDNYVRPHFRSNGAFIQGYWRS